MVNKIAVIGAGLMGAGIAYVSAWNGFNVSIVDMKQEFVDKGMERIRTDVMTGIDKGKISMGDAERLMGRLNPTVNIEDAVKDADLVIEAIFENMEAKKEVFAKIDAAAPPHAVLATNTSSLSIDELATATKRPDKFIGMHYFSPVPAMKLLELVIGEKTSEETIAAAETVGKTQGKQTVRAKNSPGFRIYRFPDVAQCRFKQVFFIIRIIIEHLLSCNHFFQVIFFAQDRYFHAVHQVLCQRK